MYKHAGSPHKKILRHILFRVEVHNQPQTYLNVGIAVTICKIPICYGPRKLFIIILLKMVRWLVRPFSAHELLVPTQLVRRLLVLFTISQ